MDERARRPTGAPAESAVLSAVEAAEFLGVHVETIRRLARRGEIPSFKVGKDWRFRRDALIQWTSERNHATVLIVDDDEQVCNTLRRMLERSGHHAISVTAGAKGLEMVTTRSFDLILLDLMMSGMSGPAFLRELRAFQPDLPVVIITGYPDSEMMHQATPYGPLMLLAKPVNQDQLEQAIQMALAGR